MPRLRQLSFALNVAKRVQLHPSRARSHARLFVRSCSCSAPQQFQNSINPGAQASQNAQLNPTTTDPPTPPTDHRTLAQTHDLFITSPYSPGSPLLLPNGAYVFQKLQAFLRAQYPQFGFQEVVTPTIYKKSLWETSGHWENYAEDMFSVRGRGASGQTENADVGQDEEFGLKPMNCPGHCLLFRDEIKSYRDLPIRYADFSALHRNEISGALTGLTRVRRFHQDDAHIFCRPDQILSEIQQTLRFVGMVYDTFGLGPYKLLLSTRPEDHFIGTVEEWDRAEQQLTDALNSSGRDWAVNEGDGAFYGPKIDIILKDAHGKEHQTATIQLDFQLPQRFDLQYQASPEELESPSQSAGDRHIDPANRRPVIVHRAIYGSLERFMALLIEHYAGKYPFWLSPRPAVVLALNNDPKVLEHVRHIQSVLSGLRSPPPADTISQSRPTPQPLTAIHLPVDIDISDRSLGKKMLEARLKKYNHIIVVGAKEVETQSLQLQLVNQPREDAAVGLLAKAVGREVGDADKHKSVIKVGMGVEQARGYFEDLVNGPWYRSTAVGEQGKLHLDVREGTTCFFDKHLGRSFLTVPPRSQGFLSRRLSIKRTRRALRDTRALLPSLPRRLTSTALHLPFLTRIDDPYDMATSDNSPKWIEIVAISRARTHLLELLRRTAYDRIITIRVKRDGSSKEFQTYRGLLYFHSNYFNKILNRDF
ncbi:class II aaRS and biotin synthetase [Lentithecium fluviatile CBS 122367]|uniref:threonine--tRNA ligase n=1 Tax=Lentithecium fluviatile CBS 122367 TaxID=1168545 RepID=A0A6G1IG36_9PLEO|nr:class II aaRS and biotin synthetase [Lentithecium fluviatile CBS 122367]